jgi:hypothetical protein
VAAKKKQADQQAAELVRQAQELLHGVDPARGAVALSRIPARPPVKSLIS